MTSGSSGRTPVYPHGWREIVNGSVEENFAPIALGTLNSLIREDVVPPTEHIQLILYLSLNPTAHGVTPSVPFSLLDRLLSFHSPSSIASSIPSHPSTSKLSADEMPQWLDWDYRRSELHRQVWRTMRRCRDEGVWTLLWESEGKQDRKGNGKRRQRNDDVDMHDEEEDEVKRIVSEKGWRLLEWLVDFWEKDQKEQTGDKAIRDISYSPLFLKQLPRPYDRNGELQRNDATLPLVIVRGAFLSPPNTENSRRESSAVRLLSLLCHTALTSNPPFHPPSLNSSLVHLFRILPLSSIQRLIPQLIPHLDWWFLAHTYALALEDMGGIRSKKTSERRIAADRRRRRMDPISDRQGQGAGNEEEEFEVRVNGLGEPTVRYLLGTILPLRASSRESDSVEKMLFIKLVSVNLFLSNWSQVRADLLPGGVKGRYDGNEKWWKEVEKSWSPGDKRGDKQSKGSEAMATVLRFQTKALLDKL
ncbi:hypothetical protein IAR55_001967 [Kwoniella newhampshirensis]|uniref:Uncharacterized protein n=1 Tax=Kwoniella newhampshirensis TaxID=1651941 RepID=A0AAW0Z3N5_9TREE